MIILTKELAQLALQRDAEKAPVSDADGRVILWLMQSGGHWSYWRHEDVARKEYGNLRLLGYAHETTLTPLVPLSALQAAEHEASHWKNYYDESVEGSREWIAKLQAAEQRNAELVAGLVGLADRWDALAVKMYALGDPISKIEAASMVNDAKELRHLAAATTSASSLSPKEKSDGNG